MLAMAASLAFRRATPLHQTCVCSAVLGSPSAPELAAAVASVSCMSASRRRPHCLEENLFLSGSRKSQALSRGAAGCKDGRGEWTGVRCMASSKTKEQPRGSLWRTRAVISKETVHAVHELKRNKDDPQALEQVFQTRIPRLLKMDMLATLDELQRQREIELALRLFDIVRKESWYKPDLFMYRSMMDVLGIARRIPDVEKKFQELQDEGITPNVVIYRELVGAYVRCQMLPQALEIHAKMVETGCGDDPLSLQFIEVCKEKMERRKKAAEAKLEAEEEQQKEQSSSETGSYHQARVA